MYDLFKLDERMMHHIERDILKLERGTGLLENLDGFLKNPEEGAGQPFYNSWPFGEETDSVFKKFLGVCRGTTTLKAVIEEALKYSERAIAAFGEDTDALAFILTDKWDSKAFKKYKKKLIQNAADHGIWYVFILVTDYGYVQIPFLPNRREEFDERVYYEADADKLPELDAPIIYREYGGFSPSMAEYVFDLKHMRWEYSSSRSGHASGKLDGRQVREFMNEIRKLSGKVSSGKNIAGMDERLLNSVCLAI